MFVALFSWLASMFGVSLWLGLTSQSSSSERRRLTQTLVGVFCRCSPPGPVVVERLAGVAVVPLRVVFAVADQPSCVLHTLAGVAVALAPEVTQAVG